MRYIVKIYGIVQGVGFRPFVYEKAKDFKIRGSVQNIGGAVVIDCLGERENIKRFMFNVIKRPPSIAKIERVECTLIKKDLSTISCLDENKFIIKENIDKKFVIKESAEQKNEMRFVSPDIAVCDECLEDIRSKGNLRYKYAFTNCTQCGPRYSIIKALPYDRQNTTMKEFYMCEECKDEYENPLNRRFHAQPNCCENCGPKLFLTNNHGEQIKCEDPIKETISLIEEGKILAIKGIGGFHLVCDGRNEQAINLLRSRKQRKDKPLALMAKDIGIVKEICYISDKEEEVISSNKRPIVILKKKYPFVLPEAIAPKQNSLGVMLPYTPLHYLLFNEKLDLLIMTSGNISSMLMEYKNEEALKHLNTVADYFLMNDREIYVQVDDSVVKVIGEVEKVIRGARGYRPYSLKTGVKNEIIAVGGQQKNAICVSKNGYAYLSQYLGDLGEFNCYKNFKYVLKHFCNLFDINAEVLAYDMHPAYSSTKYAKEKEIRKIEVQHHHAHMVSCMAEHSIYDSVIGIIFDGTGFGLDGSIWGGEFLVGNRRVFKRAGQLKYVNLQGGEQAIKEPWRCALSYLYALGYDPEKIIQGVDNEKIKVVKQALDSKINCFLSSSVGRLFDAVTALCGIRNSISYDGQAAIELENIIDYKIKESYSWDIKEENGIFNIQYKSIIEGILRDIQKKELISKISSKFHNSLIKASCDLVCKLREKEHIDKVVLSGGVFENNYLLKGIYINLIKQGFKVFYNEQIPTNDEGISFGQLHVANAILKKK
ncbi:carbamoyltransferase HypF [Clostridium beijerinckii]|uniref:Carbamoyltransferase n=1 Tax=Clostridium beijerinckii TaxID=1520 RepID=A0A1S8SCE0_CLOBE|nr:carbamoyltransferase HypF [Clostridium beijerinckii]NRY63984.1 hydrogenase maturation protein HypF [Clostridium beijerinckii]OOM63260.1 carbamoyltransferase HypF [Clostridium beijerinckii]